MEKGERDLVGTDQLNELQSHTRHVLGDAAIDRTPEGYQALFFHSSFHSHTPLHSTLFRSLLDSPLLFSLTLALATLHPNGCSN